LTPTWPLSGPLVEPAVVPSWPSGGPLVEPAVAPAASTVSLEVEFKLTSSPSPSLNSVFKDFQIYFNGVRFYTSEIFNPTSMMFDSILQGFSTQSPLAGAAGSLSGHGGVDAAGSLRWPRRRSRGGSPCR